MFVRRASLMIAVIALQLRVADSRSADDVSHVSGSPANDVITAPTGIPPRGRQPTSFQQLEESNTVSTSVPGGGQAQRKSSIPPPSSVPHARRDRPLVSTERPRLSSERSSSSSTESQKPGSMKLGDVNVTSATTSQFHVSHAPTPASSLPDTQALSTMSTSALTSMSCLWIYASNKVLRKRLCHCNVGPLEVLAKTSTALQFYFCDNEQDLLATMACYVGNNGTKSSGSRGHSNCLNSQCNIGPLWIKRSDESSQRAAFYCSSNLGLQLGHRGTTERTSSRLSLTTNQLNTADSDHRDQRQKTTPLPTSNADDKTRDVDSSNHHHIIINNVSYWSVAPSDMAKRRPKFGSHARVPGTVPNNSALQKQTNT